jgi:putative ABC transport system permease protein
MLRNYIKIAWRNLLRNKTFSLINTIGLALGIAVFIFIMQYVAFEWGANRFNKNYDSLYRVNAVSKDNASYYTAPGFAPLFKSSLPAITNYVRVADGIGSGIITYESANNIESGSFREGKVSYVDPDFFKVFTYPLAQGNLSLAEPQTLALSATTAKKYFGDASAIGKVLTVNNQFGHTPYTVTAVYQDMPEQSDIKADILLSFKTLDNPASRNDNDWANPKGLGSSFLNTYLLVNEHTSISALSKQATTIMHTLQPESKDYQMVFQSFHELHLAPSFNYPLQTFGSLLLVTLFLGIALLILIIAWVNFINLSIAQSLNRAREIGVRKVLGAMRKQLVSQFLFETLIITLAGVAIALLLVYLLQPLYNGFLDKNLSLGVLNQSWIWLAAIALILLGSLLSGGYVAWVLSAVNPIKSIGNKMESFTKGIPLRQGLVVFQFTVSVVFSTATLVLYRQLKFMHNQDLGMQVDQRLVIEGPEMNGGKIKSQSFKNQLANLPFVQKYAASNDIPGRGYNFSANGITRLNPDPQSEKKNFSMLLVDDRYFDTYGIKLASGQNFTADDVQKGYSTSARIIINQKAAVQFGFKPGERIIGEKIKWGKTYEIVGLVNDYHHLSLREAIQPMIFLPAVSSGYYTIKLKTDHLQDKINTLKNLYQAQFPGNPFAYFFLDENYDKQYKTEQKLGSIFITAAFVAVLIACMGLFGLASFIAQQRTKEIGIRKVLGASVANIIQLISTDFLKLVVIAIVIASPIAWYAMDKWLQDFAYRITVQWWMLALAGAAALVIAFVTVSFQSVKAAIANPVKSLRSE